MGVITCAHRITSGEIKHVWNTSDNRLLKAGSSSKTKIVKPSIIRAQKIKQNKRKSQINKSISQLLGDKGEQMTCPYFVSKSQKASSSTLFWKAFWMWSKYIIISYKESWLTFRHSRKSCDCCWIPNLSEQSLKESN